MAFKAFTLSHIFEEPFDSKDNFSVQCLQCYHLNLYIGSKQGSIRHLILQTPASASSKSRDANTKKLSSSPVLQICLVPVFNHLLALCNRAVTFLNMFSLETNPSIKKIPNVSLFELWLGDGGVRMVTCQSQKKLIRLYAVRVDGWDPLKDIALVQEPVALALDGDSVCVGTSDRYLLCDLATGHKEELFQHGHSKQQVLASAMGAAEFLINGPGGLASR